MKLLNNLKFLFGCLVRTSSWIFISLIFLTVLEATFPAIQLYLSKNILDNYAVSDTKNTYFWVILLVSLFFIEALNSVLNKSLKILFSEKFTINLNDSLIRAFDKVKGLEFFDNEKYLNKVELLRQYISWYPGQVLTFSLMFFANIISLVTIYLIVFSLSPLLATMILFSSIPYVINLNRFTKIDWESHESYANNLKKMNYYRELFLSRRPIKELKLFRFGKVFMDKFKTALEEIEYDYKAVLKKYSLKTIFAGLFPSLIASIGYIWVLYQIYIGGFSVGDVALYLGSIFLFTKYIKNIAFEISDTIKMLNILELFRSFINYSDSDEFSNSERKKIIFHSLEFQKVNFAYKTEGAKKNILKDLSFKINRGEKVALVGENGEGKTTIIKLIGRLYEVDSGKILLNGKDINSYNVNDIREMLSIVLQDFGKYSMTIKDNIIVTSKESKKKLLTTSSSLELDKIISKFSLKYSQFIGPEFGGVDLSGGEWQKIALARCLYKNASFLILDEPTASLDIRAENKIYKNFSKLTKNKTTLLISHRFSTIRMADKVLVLKNGKIIECGSHKELLNMQGEYSEMYRMQSEFYSA